MREDESNWFSKWEDELPSPQDLMPLSQSLITPDLALAFNINQNPNYNHHNTPPPPNSSAEFESPELSGVGSGPGSDEPARTLKRPRLVWTPQLHKRFVDAVAHLGIKNAVPKTIMQLMSVDGLTRENVASHLQKYRLYLKRMQGGNSGPTTAAMSATDHLFASSPVPPHFLHPNRANSEHFLPIVPVGAAMQHHHQQQQQQFRHFGANGQFENPFVRHSQQPQLQRMGAVPVHSSTDSVVPRPVYVEDLEPAANANNGRKVLTLFPTGDD